MGNTKIVEWVLRIAIAGEFIGHGMIALLNLNPKWAGWVQYFLPVSHDAAITILTLVGLMDLLVALIVLVKPFRLVLLWSVFWGFWTALMRPIVGEPIWDFVERSANWGAPLSLLLILGWPRTLGGWLTERDF
jgi:hypothetical protein